MSVVNYIKDSWKELRENMTWISWEEAQKSTLVVAVFSVLFALAMSSPFNLRVKGKPEVKCSHL